jgi:hypothetical protein
VVYSIGYDGFIRRHYGVDKDDVLSDDSGGTDVTLTVVSRPFLMRKPKHRKHVRVIHAASIQNGVAATLAVMLRGRGTTGASQDLTMEDLGTDTADRQRAMVDMKADAPQVEVQSTDDVRLTMLGASAQILREAV